MYEDTTINGVNYLITGCYMPFVSRAAADGEDMDSVREAGARLHSGDVRSHDVPLGVQSL